MVLIYYKDKETNEIAHFVRMNFETIGQAQAYLNVDITVPKVDEIEICIDEFEENSLTAFIFKSLIKEVRNKNEILDNLQNIVNKEIDNCRFLH